MGTYAYTQSDTQLLPSTKTYIHPTLDKTPLLCFAFGSRSKQVSRESLVDGWGMEILDNHLIFWNFT
jgi:hypothetical protein